ncbi:MAG: hypothetical protein EHM77_04460 [Planctomycetaceae bacterium]|nr:MAG: hypothetical protein EHM77_04460 [Planctomycetaceae bacterium]
MTSIPIIPGKPSNSAGTTPPTRGVPPAVARGLPLVAWRASDQHVDSRQESLAPLTLPLSTNLGFGRRAAPDQTENPCSI